MKVQIGVSVPSQSPKYPKMDEQSLPSSCSQRTLSPNPSLWNKSEAANLRHGTTSQADLRKHKYQCLEIPILGFEFCSSCL